MTEFHFINIKKDLNMYLIKKITLALSAILFIGTAQADLYLELGINGGGEDLVQTTTGDSVTAGGGIKFAAGIQNPVQDGDASVRIAVGYIFDSVDAADGEADIDALTLDAMYLVNSGKHIFGIGGTLHMNPEFTITSNTLGSLKLEFDNAAGLALQYGYRISDNTELGVTYNDLTYSVNNVDFDAGSVGLYFSNGF